MGQFYFHLTQHSVVRKDAEAMLSETYNPGEKLLVDFAGDKLWYADVETGEIIKVEVFVACMPYSDYTYAICVPSQKTEDFLYALRMCLEHLGGVPPIVMPDNLKAAVIKADCHEPTINKALEDMGNHYHFVVLPCKPRKPTHKALVEDSVKNIYNRIYAKLRNRTFTSLMELNRAVWELLGLYNKTRMQKRPYSREERFHSMEKDCLRPLPQEVYEMKCYAELKVQPDCFVELRHEKTTHFYSVPHIYIGQQAHVVFTRSIVSIYIQRKCVASHKRGNGFGHTYLPEHMASNNLAVMSRSASYYVTRAAGVSDDCKAYISMVFDPKRTSHPEEVYYKLCSAVLSLSRRYETEVVNKTCRQCMEHGIFSYRKFEAIIRNNSLTQAEDEPAQEAPTPTDGANMRGSSFFS